MIEFSTDNLPYEKVGKDEPVCIAGEVPFDIPDSWEWVRHNELFEVSGGSQPPKSKFVAEPKKGYIRLYQIRDYGQNPVPIYIPEETASKTTKKGDILLARYGASLGKVFIAEDGAYNVAMAKVVPHFSGEWLLRDFMFLYYQSDLYQSVIHGNSRSAQAGFNKEDLSAMWLPIPPLAEQRRIVQKYNELLPYINNFILKHQTLQKLNSEFPEYLKRSILQWAVQGKLVPQDPTDEPAAVLLERIRAEKQRLIKDGKIKKDKHESVIFRRDNSHYEKLDGTERCIDDELPFEIPETWEWIRLGTIFQHNTGKALNTSNRDGQKLTYITTSNLYWDRFVLDSLKEMFFTDSEIEKCTVQQGDLLVCEGGDIGRAAIWDYDIPMRIQNHIHRLRAYVPVCTRFFYYLFYLYKGAGWIGGKGIAIQGLSSNAVHNLLFPLPPLKEQFRIVEMIDNTLQIVSAL